MPSVTLTFSAAIATRIKDAFERGNMNRRDENNDPLPIEVEDLKDFVINKLSRFVRDSERQLARDAADQSVTTVDIT